ncbi:uracil-DNA glycosylase [Amylibacter ulvae]|uniref:Type-4 uracil-DNA glycosylase n=1 Tax=Paramylibacter ulvae TaxID=1651968 RepID=A0ABQ3D650_9RHOB|nr:uracil-DNA glycosylase [Amylibacter ulvae]GHA57958.1 uracil-DNA glycosylase [Amylibacter ulvae]
MTTQLDYFAAKAALEWLYDLGVDETIGEKPVNRYDEPASKPKFKMGATSNIAPIDVMPQVLPVQDAAPDVARMLAQKCETLDALRDAMAVFDLCALKKGARNLVFADGNPNARVMVISESPSREEDIQGKPFLGQDGALLEKMFGAIGLNREGQTDKDALYLTCAMPWRPPRSRHANGAEIEMMVPFLERHVQLVKPDVLVLMGNTACQAGLGKSGVSRLRGKWSDVFGVQTIAMEHPHGLLRDPLKKRDAWADLLAIKSKLAG